MAPIACATPLVIRAGARLGSLRIVDHVPAGSLPASTAGGDRESPVHERICNCRLGLHIHVLSKLRPRIRLRFPNIHSVDILLPVASSAANADASKPTGLSASPAVSLPRNSLSLLTGTFRGDAPEMRIQADQGKLLLLVQNQRYELRHIGSYRFEILQAPVDASIKFDLPGNEPARALRFEGPQGALAMSRVNDAMPSAQVLREFAGKYFSEELQSTVEISASDSGLFIRGPGIRSRILPLVTRDEFETETSISLRFARGPGGSVSGFALSRPRSRNIRFDRVVSAR